MPGINLLQNDQQTENRHKSTLVNLGIGIPIGILVLVLLAYGGFKIYNGQLEEKHKAMLIEIQKEAESVIASDVNLVADFEERLQKSEKEIYPENYAKEANKEFFEKVEGAVIQGVQIISLNNKEGAVDIDMITGDFLTVAKQILSFKKSDYFKEVNISNISRDEDAKVLFTLGMKAGK